MKNALAVVGLVFSGSISNTYFTEAFIVEMERRFSLLTLKFSIKKAQLSILAQFSSLCFEVTEPLLSPLPLQGLLTLVFQLNLSCLFSLSYLYRTVYTHHWPPSLHSSKGSTCLKTYFSKLNGHMNHLEILLKCRF